MGSGRLKDNYPGKEEFSLTQNAPKHRMLGWMGTATSSLQCLENPT